MPNPVNNTMWIPIFEWYVVRCGSKKRYQNNMCLKRIGLHAQNIKPISRFIFHHNWGSLYDHLMSMRIFTLIMNKIFI